MVDIAKGQAEYETYKHFMYSLNKDIAEGGFMLADGTPQNLEDFMAVRMELLSAGYPTLLKLMQIAQLVPMTSVACERGFSAMRQIKSKGRSNMNDDTLDCIMRISTASAKLPVWMRSAPSMPPV
jgi:hypothetical protein